MRETAKSNLKGMEIPRFEDTRRKTNTENSENSEAHRGKIRFLGMEEEKSEKLREKS